MLGWSASQLSRLLPLHLHADFHPAQADLCAPPLPFRRQPSQLNWPPDTVSRNSGLGKSIVKRGVSLAPPAMQGGPSYAKQSLYPSQYLDPVKLPGSVCPGVGRPHLHSHFNFAEEWFKTVASSLGLSCRSELTRQGITLP